MFLDRCMGLGVLRWKYPELYAYAPKKNISVKSFIQGDIENFLWLPLSMVASAQLTELQATLSSFHLSLEENEIWSYIWGADTFSS
jgi:hypothetical protein